MTGLRITTARNGEPTAILGTRHLHSRVSPREEAARFVIRQIDRSCRLVLVIGPGLGHSFAALRELLPEARLFGLSLSSELAQAQHWRPDRGWDPGSDEPLRVFLTRELSDLDSSSVLVLEWPPVVAAFPKVAESVRAEVSAHLRRGHASLVTRGASGRRWLRNQIFNFRHGAPAAFRRSGSGISAAVLIGSGPSAERIIPGLGVLRDRLEFWVTGSALDAVVRLGLRPDVVVVTDAAVYAGEHLRPAISGLLRDAPVAAPLSATRAVAGCERLVVLSEGDVVEEELFTRAGLSAPLIPPHGTVSATAAALIRTTGDLPIVCVGVDFAWRSGRSHARPHLSEIYRRTTAHRCSPEETQVYALARGQEPLCGEWTSSPSLLAYSEWFHSVGRLRFAPIHSLSTSPAAASLPAIGLDHLASLEPRYQRISCAPSPLLPEAERTRIARQTLCSLIRTSRTARPPDRPRDLETACPSFASLAVKLALPQLLRWYRDDHDQRDRWAGIQAIVEQELTDLLRETG